MAHGVLAVSIKRFAACVRFPGTGLRAPCRDVVTCQDGTQGSSDGICRATRVALRASCRLLEARTIQSFFGPSHLKKSGEARVSSFCQSNFKATFAGAWALFFPLHAYAPGIVQVCLAESRPRISPLGREENSHNHRHIAAIESALEGVRPFVPWKMLQHRAISLVQHHFGATGRSSEP